MSAKPDLDHLIVFSQSSSGKKKRRGKAFFRFILFLSVAASFIGGCFWLYQNYSRLIFVFQENQYENIVSQQESFLKALLEEKKVNEEELEQLQKSYEDSIASSPEDPILFYHYGLLQYHLFNLPLRKSNIIAADILLERYTDKYKFSKQLSYEVYKKAITLLRKAIILGLPVEQETEIKNKLAYLYIFSHRSYFEEAANLFSLQNSNSSVKQNQELTKVLISTNTPAWSQLKKLHPEIFVSYLKAIYYLRIKNRPFGFSFLQKIAKMRPAAANEAGTDNNPISMRVKAEIDTRAVPAGLETDTDTIETNQEEIALVNNAFYLMGYLEKRYNRNLKKQLHFYSQIRSKEFLNRHHWFFDEYLLLLRFLGQRKEAKDFLSKNN